MGFANRRRICLGCRTLLGEGEACGPVGLGHRVVSLDDAKGRSKLDDEVWGPDSRRRALRKAARAGAGGGAAGGALDGCGGLDGCDIAGGGADLGGIVMAIVVVVVCAIVGMLLWWIFRAIFRLVRDMLDRPVPHGALAPQPFARAKRRVSGVVRSGRAIETPWGADALGYMMAVHAKSVFGGDAMLRDAEVGELEIALDDGRVMRVPAGRAWINAKAGDLDADSASVSAISDTFGDGDHERPLVPGARLRGVQVEVGDRVDVLCDVELAPSEAAASAYRANAGVVVPVGVPVLRVRKGARVRVDASPEEKREAEQAAAEEAAAEEARAEAEAAAEEARATQKGVWPP